MKIQNAIAHKLSHFTHKHTQTTNRCACATARPLSLSLSLSSTTMFIHPHAVHAFVCVVCVQCSAALSLITITASHFHLDEKLDVDSGGLSGIPQEKSGHDDPNVNSVVTRTSSVVCARHGAHREFDGHRHTLGVDYFFKVVFKSILGMF